MSTTFTVYVSTKTEVSDPNDVRDIAIASSRNNQISGISGILMGVGEHFLQVLEGAEEVVDELLQKIEADLRHKDLRVLYRGPLEERVFGRWSMGCVSSESTSQEGQLYFDDLAHELAELCAVENDDGEKYDKLKDLLVEIPKRFADQQFSIE